MVQNVFSSLVWGHMCFRLHVFFLGHKRKDKRQWKQFCSFSSIPWTLLEPPWGPWAAWPRCCCCWWWCWWWRWSRPCWPAPPSPIIPTPAPPLCLTKGNTLILSLFNKYLLTEYFLIAEKQGKSSQNVLLQKYIPTFFVHDGLKFNSRGATTSIVAFQMSQKSTFQFQHFKDFSIIIRVSYTRKSLVGGGDFS